MTPVSGYTIAESDDLSDANGHDQNTEDLVGRTVLLPTAELAQVCAVASSGRLWVRKWRHGWWRGSACLVDVENCVPCGRHVVVDTGPNGRPALF